MSAREEIIDYSDYSEEIEKWISIKGEEKYLRFINILKNKNVEVRWSVLTDTYRYDKRLLINLFTYFSFFEEFLRAQIWNFSSKNYKKLEEQNLNKEMDEVIAMKDKVQYIGFSVDALVTNKDFIYYLRNRVSHNKIILESVKDEKSIREMLIAFKDSLPEAYQKGFISDINKCAKELNIPSCLIIEM